MRAVVLAAGFATRLYPLTRTQAKPLLEVGGRPILSHTLAHVLAELDVEDVTVVCNARFAREFRDWRDREDWPLPVHVLDDGATDPDTRLGATGDLAFALRERAPAGQDLLVLAGDNLLDCRLARARALLAERRAPVLIVREVERRGGPSPYNEVELDSDGRVLRFREKPAEPHSPLAAIAVYFYPPAVADWLESYLREGGNPDAPGHFIAWLHAQTGVFATPLEGRWFDIGDAQTLAEARRAFPG